jgi:hypothetical protein
MRGVLRVGVSIGFAATAALLALPFAAVRKVGYGFSEAQTWSGLALTMRLASRPHLEELIWDQSRRAYVMQDVTAAYVPQAHIPGLVLPVQWAFIVAAVLIVAGLSAEILSGRRWPTVVQMVAGFGAAAAITIGELVALRSLPRYPFDESVPAYGFWLALCLLVMLGLANLVTFLSSRDRRNAPATK